MNWRGSAAALSGLLLALAAGAAPPATNDAREFERDTRRALENGRALLVEGRADASERVLRRGLKQNPADHRLERALAHALDALGRPEEASRARSRADVLHPRPDPPPSTPLLPNAGDRLILLVRHAAEPLDAPGPWPDDALERRLTARIEARLPGATVRRAEPASVADAKALLAEHAATRVLSLRVDRAFCGFSVKDGQIAVADLRTVVAFEDGPVLEIPTHSLVEDPLPRDDCAAHALDLALEAAIAPLVLSTPPPAATRVAGSRARALFPDLDRRITVELRKGRAQLAAGRLAAAETTFEGALRIDPEDEIARAFRDDTRASLALAQQLARDAETGDATRLDPRLSPSQRAAAEIALRHEQQRREEWLTALAVLDEDVVRPSDAALAKLRTTMVQDPETFGAALARERARGEIDARAAYAPDGSVIARYYFPSGSPAPVLREEDTDGDGATDRWITYAGTARHEIFEDRLGRGRPDLQLVFAEGGNPLERVEIDRRGDDTPESVLHYREGVLSAEETDTDGDGRLDRFDHFDAMGLVAVREEDLDGDGRIDVRSEFESGKLVRREISSPEHLPES